MKTARMIYVDPTNLVSANTMLQDVIEDIDAVVLTHTNAFAAMDIETSGIYVDGTTGLDTQAGDELHPVATIGQAIVLATAAGGAGRIIVSAGTYAEENLTSPTGWSIEGRDRVATIITGAGGAVPVIVLNGLQNNLKNLTIAGLAGQASLIQLNNAAGTYLIDNVQLNGGVASATVGILNTASLLTLVTKSDVNVAAGVSTGAGFQVVLGTLEFQDCIVQSDQNNPVDTGTVTIRNSTIVNYNIGGAGEGVINATTAATINLVDCTLNNTNPAAGANGYGVHWGDVSAVVINYTNVRLQNNGGYVAAVQPVVPESAGGGGIIQNLIGPLYAAPADVNQGAVGLDGFENGLYPKVFPGVNSPLWAGLGGGATPFAAADEHDQWSAIMRIARGLDIVINTILTTGTAGPGMVLAAYAGGQIP